MSEVPVQPVADKPAMSFFQRLVGIYIRPRRTFEDIARRPDFALPLIIVMLVDLFVVWIGLVRFGVRGCAQLAFTRGAPELLSFEMDRKFVVLQIIAPYWQALA